MKLSQVIVLRPVCVFVFLAFVVLLLPSLVVPYWYHKIRRIESDVKVVSHNVREELQSQIEKTTKLLQPINSSALNLARFMSSSLNETELSFARIEKKVAPTLFQALSVVPFLSQISYIGLDGLMFSYYNDGDQTLAVYSNTTFLFNSSNSNTMMNYTWYTQSVNRESGKLYGEAIVSHPMIAVNESWFKEALNNTNGFASLGLRWNSDDEPLFLNTASIDGIGAVSLGFPVKPLTKFFSDIDLHGANLYLATKDGELLIQGIPNTKMEVINGDSVSIQLLNSNGGPVGHIGNVSCNPHGGTSNATHLDVEETKYILYCSSLEILGVQSVYMLAFPRKGLENLVQRNSKLALMVLIVMIITMVISIITFLVLIVRAARREMHLCAALIKQMEATQQAERKHLNKSLAFANANHDVRASLAGITGLIEISYDEVAPGSELETNLRQMDACCKDLLGLLNSILDTSKIEAGKMQLDEEEFNLAELLEDVVDLYHPVGMKKGVDVLLDPCDGSILKFSQVKGDRGKLKQILCNLLSNAVKFTTEGHISVRAWAKKPSLEKSIIASNRNGFLNRFSCLFYKNNEALETMKTVEQNPNTMEFVFEVDDTGKGIPKEKQKSVFENFVQVKETALGQGGTGLGLGIVQSLVRLMGGEIGITDKEVGERGTCFKFNVFLTTSETANSNDNVVKQDDIEALATDSHQQLALSIRSQSPKIDGSSHVILLIQNDERRKIAHKFIESLGIKVSVVKQWENLPQTFKRIKRKMNLSRFSSSGKSDWSSKSEGKSASHSSFGANKDVSLSAMDGNGSDQILPAVPRRSNPRGFANFVLVVIDASAGPFFELGKAVADFRKDLNDAVCRVVWLDKPTSRNINFNGLKEENRLVSPNDHVICKPFHGSRLYQVIRFLPEFGGTSSSLGNLPKPRRENSSQAEKNSTEASSSKAGIQLRSNLRPPTKSAQIIRKGEIQQDGSTCSEEIQAANIILARQPSKQLELGSPSGDKPLSGTKFLVAEDNIVLRKLAVTALSKLGAEIETCENGLEALEAVAKGLKDQGSVEASMILPYDYILMDCEMPVMNGLEATTMIRKEEKYYGVHIPIIALTAHTEGEELKKATEAGMDFHLIKPLSKEKLLETIRSIHGK